MPIVPVFKGGVPLLAGTGLPRIAEDPCACCDDCCDDVICGGYVNFPSQTELTLTLEINGIVQVADEEPDCRPIVNCDDYCDPWNGTFIAPIEFVPGNMPWPLERPPETACEWRQYYSGASYLGGGYQRPLGCGSEVTDPLYGNSYFQRNGYQLGNRTCDASALLVDAFDTSRCLSVITGEPWDIAYPHLLMNYTVEVPPLPDGFDVDDYLAATPADHAPLHVRIWRFYFYRVAFVTIVDYTYPVIACDVGVVEARFVEFYPPGSFYGGVCHHIQLPPLAIDRVIEYPLDSPLAEVEHPYIPGVVYQQGMRVNGYCTAHPLVTGECFQDVTQFNPGFYARITLE
jgi:hypothetical protein